MEPGASAGADIAEASNHYPRNCTPDAVPEGFVAVTGANNLCVPALEAAIVASTDELPPTPSGYSDDVPASLLLAPNAAAEESSELTSAERSSIASTLRHTRFHDWNIGRSCDAVWTEAVGRVSLDCTLDDHFVSGTPRVTRNQECETMPGESCGECENSDDCNGWLCGCPQSRCTLFGACTPCPSERICDDPTFEVTVPTWSVRATFESGPSRELARRAVGENWRILVGARVNRAYRDVRTRRPTSEELEAEEYERGDLVVENDTGYLLGLEVYYVGYIQCTQRECHPTRDDQVVNLLTGRGTRYDLTADDGRGVTAICAAGVCTGRLSDE
jgi:hypothetical protein